uniref:Uncharacterized protein n=1 Tax=Podoviridae sp. ct4s49 TaxID=2823555 RepID=A0A8S5LED1_9CAUD|nr:MAG TPA: hypothetical protein [Podoviridae sp. ct4s49]
MIWNLSLSDRLPLCSSTLTVITASIRFTFSV